MQTIYNAQGEPKECEAVDAREHIASGRWFNEAPVKEVAKDPSLNASFSKAELLEKLDAIGAVANAQMNKADLVAMLDEFEAME